MSYTKIEHYEKEYLDAHHDSALNVTDGVESQPVVNPYFVRKKRRQMTTEEYVAGILEGNITILAQAITLIESNNPTHYAQAQEIIEKCLPHSGRSIRIGITGVPGAGKSSFIEAVGNMVTSYKHKLAVLAIDPSSERSGGSILGDKTRMESICHNPNIFVRPSPSAGSLGGTNINKCDGERIFPNRMDGIAVGVQLFCNFDKLFCDRLASTRTRRSLPIILALGGTPHHLTLTVSDTTGNTLSHTIEGSFDLASKPEVAIASMRSSLGKSGGSVFDIEDVSVEFEGEVPFVPTGVINGLRREALERFQEMLMDIQPPRNIATEDKTLPYPVRHLSGEFNVVNSLAREFYADHGVERIDEGYDALPDLEGVDVMRTPYCIRRECGECLRKGSRWRDPLYLHQE